MFVSISNDECTIKCSKAEFDIISALVYNADFEVKHAIGIKPIAQQFEQAETLFEQATGVGSHGGPV